MSAIVSLQETDERQRGETMYRVMVWNKQMYRVVASLEVRLHFIPRPLESESK